MAEAHVEVERAYGEKARPLAPPCTPIHPLYHPYRPCMHSPPTPRHPHSQERWHRNAQAKGELLLLKHKLHRERYATQGSNPG